MGACLGISLQLPLSRFKADSQWGQTLHVLPSQQPGQTELGYSLLYCGSLNMPNMEQSYHIPFCTNVGLICLITGTEMNLIFSTFH